MDYKQINKLAWNQRADIHKDSTFYDLDGFVEGKQSLKSLELNLIGDVAGQSMLHLQCHMGSESLGWQRLGAQVTGVDISDHAIELARQFAVKTDLNARFVCADVYDYLASCELEYDLVYTSYGVLCWLPDLECWARGIAQALKPGGAFYLVEFHPFNDVLMGYSYFHQSAGMRELEPTYTENHGNQNQNIVTWSYSLADVLTALLNAGLMIESFQEYDHSPYQCFEHMVETERDKFQRFHQNQAVPVVYSIKATKREI